MTDVASLNTDQLSRREAEDIASEIDPRAGGFFHNALVRAVLMGAERQREKTGQGSWAGLRERYHDQT